MSLTNSERLKSRREKARLEGICQTCFQRPSRQNRTQCAECSDMQAEYAKRRREGGHKAATRVPPERQDLGTINFGIRHSKHGNSRQTIAERFWSKVKKADASECWKWTGTKMRLGYGNFTINHHLYKAHRVAYAITNGGIEPDLEIDHICRNRGCVNPAHLRLCTRSENLRNTGKPSTNTSGFKGVSWHKAERKWLAQITIHNKTICLGYFKTKEEAYGKYCESARELHGEFANVD